jgi:hypothetical protein
MQMKQVELLLRKALIASQPERITKGIPAGKGGNPAWDSGDAFFISGRLGVIWSVKVNFMSQLHQAGSQTIHADADPIENREG